MSQFIIFLVNDTKMKKLLTHEIERLDAEGFKQIEKRPVLMVLDDIRSMHNVGSAFRTSDAFCIEGLILGGITATPPHNEIHKSALGAEDVVRWEHQEDLVSFIEKKKKEGYRIACVEQAEGSVMLQDFALQEQEKICVIFGNEVFGVNDKLIELSDLCLEIPQFGTKHSFNVSVSMGIVLWQLLGK